MQVKTKQFNNYLLAVLDLRWEHLLAIKSKTEDGNPHESSSLNYKTKEMIESVILKSDSSKYTYGRSWLASASWFKRWLGRWRWRSSRVLRLERGKRESKLMDE